MNHPLPRSRFEPNTTRLKGRRVTTWDNFLSYDRPKEGVRVFNVHPLTRLAVTHPTYIWISVALPTEFYGDIQSVWSSRASSKWDTDDSFQILIHSSSKTIWFYVVTYGVKKASLNKLNMNYLIFHMHNQYYQRINTDSSQKETAPSDSHIKITELYFKSWQLHNEATVPAQLAWRLLCTFINPHPFLRPTTFSYQQNQSV